ncbi:tRNA-specific adenosine deaminase [Yamadazyma tenuis]|uniref:A to I editase domain-containing protein n=1 Tax=Candida tenuis (strain ATCC 10573 / BCRC 21748 / CBS 615 / JCM 9827 / NBRC 10315 / NRRL Y-1498 / VKM Y-70) TaxID=590646 RepID=G3B4J2_CANTC|nr:uncharacterized protein CANTEDRAFT_130230 [Yamadazyma tenuis ATCC 10573]EGV63842.1 hypothetical protein CANTEDRAFT_130230 [Yamadazyma tenuis ATCC 10573]WEJ96544.1 tRNA-specific adenosine deaminase [Yamadazyma tenuis]
MGELHDDSSQLAQKIADTVVQTFNGLNIKSGKPITRSNGVQEWTVMAGIVLIQGDTNIPISICTGVKALPDQVRSYSEGRIVHDLHAEILCFRAFNRFLIDECQNRESTLVEKNPDTEKYVLKPHIKVALFVTEPPCGDASMGYLSAKTSNNTPWEIPQEDGAGYKRRKTKTEMVRGRNHFDQLGIVRTKPGRSDSVKTLSKSCSDKICLKQLVGLNNSITSQFYEPVYLDFLVLHKTKYHEPDIRRCFDERFPITIGKKLKTIVYVKNAYPYEKHEGAVPSPLSLVHMAWRNETQVINNGVKNGSFIKNRPPNPGGESSLCNKALVKHSMLVYEPKQKTYQELKEAQTDRNILKKDAKQLLENWVDTTKDNFLLG